MTDCPANYKCFKCKMVGDHWIMQCPTKHQQPSKSGNNSHHILAQYSTNIDIDPCTVNIIKNPVTKCHPLTDKENKTINTMSLSISNEQQSALSYFDHNAEDINPQIISKSDLSPTANEFVPITSTPINDEEHNPFIYINNDFEREIETFYNTSRSSPTYINKQDELFQFISQCISSCNDKWDIFKFGGNVWKIDSKHSDIDMAIDLCKDKVLRFEKQDILCNILDIIKERRNTLNVEDITNARYPIITIKDTQNDIKIDLSISDEHCKKTTQFILSLLNEFNEKYHIPIRKLIVFIKYWTKQCGINNALKWYLNSFGYTLMAIKYIQCILFSDEFIIGSKTNLSCLIFGFFYFYGYIFDHNKHSISICDEDNNYDKYLFAEKTRYYLLEIIDPVNRYNNVAKNVRNREYFNIQLQFQNACQIYKDFIKKNHNKNNNVSLLKALTQSA